MYAECKPNCLLQIRLVLKAFTTVPPPTEKIQICSSNQKQKSTSDQDRNVIRSDTAHQWIAQNCRGGEGCSVVIEYTSQINI